MATPSEVFRDNLRRLAAVFGLDAGGLTAVLGWRREDKKWLSRVWHSGLARNDYRSSGRLYYLAKLFGLEATDLWVPDVQPNPEKLPKSMKDRWANRSD